MAKFEVNLSEFLRLAGDHPSLLSNPSQVPVGTIVVCDPNAFKGGSEVKDFGVVLYHGESVELVPFGNKVEHPDGKKGEVFVNSFDKTKRPAKNKLSGIVLFCSRCFLFVCVIAKYYSFCLL